MKEKQSGCKEYLVIEDKSVQNIVEREPGKHTVKKAKMVLRRRGRKP